MKHQNFNEDVNTQPHGLIGRLVTALQLIVSKKLTQATHTVDSQTSKHSEQNILEMK